MVFRPNLSISCLYYLFGSIYILSHPKCWHYATPWQFIAFKRTVAFIGSFQKNGGFSSYFRLKWLYLINHVKFLKSATTFDLLDSKPLSKINLKNLQQVSRENFFASTIRVIWKLNTDSQNLYFARRYFNNFDVQLFFFWQFNPGLSVSKFYYISSKY